VCVRRIWVVISTWSDSPFSVSGSHVICCWQSLASIKSMHDLSVPLANVKCAGGPGWSPFRIYQLCCSHSSRTHLALEFIVLSKLLLGIVLSPIFGDSSPILAFQSPHMVDLAPSGMLPMISST
jgi:hypothetical protein